MRNVLIVDDEEDIRSLLSEILKEEGYVTTTASNAAQALQKVETENPAVVILDIWLEGSELDGLGVLKSIKTKYPNIQVIMISGHGNIETAVKSIKRGAYDYIEKPFKRDNLLRLIDRAMEVAYLSFSNRIFQEQQNAQTNIIGSSKYANSIRAQILVASANNSRIFISGPKGAGKSVIARAIHSQSKRAYQPFIEFNASKYKPEEIEAYLFGTVNSDKAPSAGFVAQADGGSLYINEIAYLPLSIQNKLLNFLQKNTYEKVGSDKEFTADVRIISSSSQDIESLIDSGKLQKSLFFRLNVINIKALPLKDRKDDIKDFIQYFITAYCGNDNSTRIIIADETHTMLSLYEWPANVRQLRNIIEWLCIYTAEMDDKVITSDMLPQNIFSCIQAKHSSLASINHSVISKQLKQARDVFEKHYIMAQLDRFGGNISRTAQFIGMDRTALHRKLKSLGIVDFKTLDCA